MTSAAAPPASCESFIFGLLGSPNAGKTTLFNALTGLRARVGNYPGVTVERREAELVLGDSRALLVDLPGTYGLTPISEDEAVVKDVLDGSAEGIARPDALIVVVDACSLPRSLPFIGEVIRLERPMCVVLSMLDELAARGGSLDIGRLKAIQDLVDDEFRLYSGDDFTLLPFIEQGGHGVVTVSGNVAAAKGATLCRLALEGRSEEAKALDDTLQALNKAAGFLRTRLSKGSKMRTVPQLRFMFDSSVGRGAYMEELIGQALASDEREQDDEA